MLNRGEKGRAIGVLVAGLVGAACRADDPEGIHPSQPAATQVKMDFYHRPLPEIPLPNDLATRFDETSLTKRRINASMLAPTGLERRVRRLADELDGWGVYQPISIGFTSPLDVGSILRGHRDVHYDLDNDVVYLINVDRDSPNFGKAHHLDVGNGNYPVVLENRDYWENDPRGFTLALAFEEADEDTNQNAKLDPGEDANGNGILDPGEDLDADGILDPPEDTDADGILDRPNYLPGHRPALDDLAGRADALMSFYEEESNTLIVRPMVPLDEQTTYAVVVTRRLLDRDGQPVGSPFPSVNHTAQTEALTPLLDVLPDIGLSMDDVAFAFAYTTQSIDADWLLVRDGLYGHGIQGHLGRSFPPEVKSMEVLRDASFFPEGLKNPYVIYTENLLEVLEDIAVDTADIDRGTKQFEILIESQKYVDYHVIGSFDSPQLFERYDAEGKLLPYDEQSWPPDLQRRPAKTRSEPVYFWVTVPRKEISRRGEGGTPPVVIVGHGYTSSRFEMLFYSGYFARQGLATVAIDCVSHGLSIHPVQQGIIADRFREHGVAPFVKAVFKDRAFDQNSDLKPDSGADFWTSYLFHTRDVVRQSTLDYMQLIRVLRSFDGTKRFSFDLNGDGENELAGDFDGDGVVDVGRDAHIGVTGGSLGGIMSMALGALEPELEVVVPIAGGGGLSDIGVRSKQGGVRESVGLRLLSPVYTGTIDAADGKMELATIIPDLNDDVRLPFAKIAGVLPGDTLLLDNLQNDERGCGYVSPEGRVRLSVESDLGDLTRFSFYRGPALVLGDTECGLLFGREPYQVVETFDRRIVFQGQTFDTGTPLVALAEGLGLRRAHPSLRRFMGLAQLILDPADPAVVSRHLTNEPLRYPGTGQLTGAHGLIVTTVGDMNVPASSGVSVGRAAGYIGYLEDDPRYGKPANQQLIDTYTAEAVNGLKRFTNPEGEGIHFDVENFSQGTDMWGEEIPRLDPPLRLGLDRPDRTGGFSGAIFPYAVPTGQHGFDLPGEMTEDAKKRCLARCTETGDDPCGCNTKNHFDIGFFMFNVLGRYFSTAGTSIDFDLCNSRDDCPWKLPAPELRAESALP